VVLPDLPVPAHQPAPVRPASRRRKILDYVASRGGEITSDSGQGLRRQIADALGERPTPVGQALIALEKAGIIERDIDVTGHRCYAIRLVAAEGAWVSAPRPEKVSGSVPPGSAPQTATSDPADSDPMHDTTTDDAVASERDGVEEVFVSDEDSPQDEHLSEALDRLSEAILAFNQRVGALQRQMTHGL
jgi:DNA-binding MarR family transcriptional regulator